MESIQDSGLSDISGNGEAVPKRQFFIFGNNIKHSLSPALHNAGFKEYGLPHHYSIHESPSVDGTVEEIIARPDFGGASVTFPHKLQVDRLLDSILEGAKKVGAVNTIIVGQTEDGRRLLLGDNTDWVGIRNCIRKGCVTGLQSASALVLGAGGAARAACYALQEYGISEVVIVNRTRHKAEELAARLPGLNVHIYETLEEASSAGVGEIRTVVACVPADDLPEEKIPAGLFSESKTGILVEMAYRPQVTGMMQAAGRHPGWKIYRGIDVLEEQAYAQFELWTSKPAPIKVMREAMRANVS
jgi:shikimate-5-dehydrogenase